jgi:cytochrome c5
MKFTVITCLVFATAYTTPVFASQQDDIADRIKPVGEVCVEGQACTDAPVPATAATPETGSPQPGGLDVADTYQKTCAVCHGAGVAGAPKLASKEDWAPRIAKGTDVLYESAINGLAPAMPAKGMCFTCSDDDLKKLVDYMVDSSR